MTSRLLALFAALMFASLANAAPPVPASPGYVDNTAAKMPGVFASGTLANSTPLVVSTDNAPLPATITLKSSDAGRKIEVKTTAGDYYTPAPDVTDPSGTHQIIVYVTTSITAVRITGAAADTWSIE